MHLISNQQCQEAIDFLTAFCEITPSTTTKLINLKRRSQLLVKKLRSNPKLPQSVLRDIKQLNH